MRWGRCDDATPAYANQTYIQSFRFGCPFHGPLMAFLIAGGATHGTLRERRPVGATDDCILVKKKEFVDERRFGCNNPYRIVGR